MLQKEIFMPPKSQITRQMILDAGFELIRRNGADALNVRSLAAELHCSTQPIMYQFASVEKLKSEIYSIADAFHSEYIMNVDFENGDPMMGIGLRYISFAAEEKHLFRFLFQSDKYANSGFEELIGGDALAPIFAVLQQEAEITAEQSREAFASLFLAAHGIASLLANNSMVYDEKYSESVLTNVFMGVIGMMKGGNE